MGQMGVLCRIRRNHFHAWRHRHRFGHGALKRDACKGSADFDYCMDPPPPD
jgi:hypothetical protein